MNASRLCLILLIAFLVILPSCHNGTTPTPTATVATLSPTATPVSSISLKVETAGAVWSNKFITGLSGRTSVEGGMLFDFEKTVTVSFQTEDTLIPLSIAFISEDKTILNIQNMEPLSDKLYVPASPYRYALEVNQGYFEEKGITVGDRIEFQSADSKDYLTILIFSSAE